MADFVYKSFCWSFGTTSFRTENFNKTVEEQLRLLKEFWSKPGMDELQWSDNFVQSEYYDFIKEKGFVTGDAQRKDKDAREKTSGLADMGLVNGERVLTEVGENLLNIVSENNFKNEGLMNIPKDCYIYLKQLIKFGEGIDGKYIRPFIVIIYLLCELEYLSYDEFTYLVPLCVDKTSINIIKNEILEYRRGTKQIDDILYDRLMSMNNYKDILKFFLENDVTEELICEIGINRKSRGYDIPYYNLYSLLNDKFVKKINNNEYEIYESIDKLSGNTRILWKKLLFDTSSKKAVQNNGLDHFNHTDFDNVVDENEFKNIFFKYMHLFKAKATLKDYFDLNRRYIKTTNCVRFSDEKVELDVVPSIVFNASKETLYNIVDSVSNEMYIDIPIEQICPNIIISETEFIELANNKYNKDFKSTNQIYTVIDNDRYQRFNELIDEKFSTESLIDLLDKFEIRDDKYINSYITEEADIPTIFEYVLGIIWYIISDRKGKILDYMKLSLDADLLPRSHAAGGDSDIVYEYNNEDCYASHDLLIEATLSDKTNQRRMEMEPVSRHLGDHILATHNNNDYAVFITNYLDANVISDFRNRKNMTYYDRFDSSNYIPGMKIIPIETQVLKEILLKKLDYNVLYKIFDDAFNANGIMPHEWYKTFIANKIK